MTIIGLILKRLLFITLFLTSTFLFANELQKAKIFDYTQNIDNWLMSEKLDGVRAYWDGKNLKTRQGKIIAAPVWFTKNFPPFELDGELWSKRNDFENIQSIVLSKTPTNKWKEITYNLFETPHAQGDFVTRLKKSQEWFLNNPNTYVKIVPQKLCQNVQELETYLNEIIENNGEGVMLKNPNAAYEEGLTHTLLKVKKFDDMEGVVIGHKYTQTLLKSLVIQLTDKTIFHLGNGFSQYQRENPPKVGSVVTFKYYGLTKNGKPKFASFLHERKD